MPLRRSKIGWCDYSGADLNFVIGCTPVSEGCAHCYAKAWALRAGREFWDITLYPNKLKSLLDIDVKLEPGDVPYRRGSGSKPIMFPVDLGDLFHSHVKDDFILQALSAIASRDDADWVLLTKRPKKMLDLTNYWLDFWHLKQLPSHIWCMVTAENQKRLEKRVPILLQVKATVLGVSAEPMLEPLDFYQWLRFGRLLDWIIVGAESGKDRRPFKVAWAEDVHEQCVTASVPFFFKQRSGLYPGTNPTLRGCEIKEFPG